MSATNLTGLLEALKTTTDAKTLASPKVLALNGQRSRIQIGEKLGYRVLSNTQTATLENVEFLDVGVVLEVTPTISRDDQLLLKINPKVSTGQVDADTGLPNEATSEVETNVFLQDGQGIVIGGLIQEDESDSISKVFFLGDLYIIGSLFQRRVAVRSRKEVIFFLIPRIVPCGGCQRPCDIVEQERARTRLFHGVLHANLRPWEPRFPSCFDEPTSRWLKPLHCRIFGHQQGCGCDPRAYDQYEELPGGDASPTLMDPSLNDPETFDDPPPDPATTFRETYRARPSPSLPVPAERQSRPIIARLPTMFRTKASDQRR